MEDNSNYRRYIGERIKKIELDTISIDDMEIEDFRKLYIKREKALKKIKRKKRMRIIMILLISVFACGGIMVCTDSYTHDPCSRDEMQRRYSEENVSDDGMLRKKLKMCRKPTGNCKLIL